MSKAVMLSIRPKWCEKIISGEKTIEVRKNRPKLKTPFKCYVYETQGWVERDGIMEFALGGRVIGEFTCDRIFPINVFDNGRTGHGWHISNLKIYDTPKELSKFSRPFENCIDKVCDEFGCASCENGGHIKRPPQSWCYVEAM